ncbi:hypothetical protein [Andreprevotia lacus]|uniref:hypothetical protein n=1 Tax=Andreprevotia lacus TaxID=1121000 RepID=UPI00111C03E1|nr:hypothetical protein [Andreprevotia lacus]
MFQSPADISHVRLEWGELLVTLISGGDRKVVIAKFKDVAGFRVLDEGNLLEFWPTCSAHNGWLFQIFEHGWLDLESSRAGFLLDKKTGVSEFFIASQNSCINILSSREPSIEIVPI